MDVFSHMDKNDVQNCFFLLNLTVIICDNNIENVVRYERFYHTNDLQMIFLIPI